MPLTINVGLSKKASKDYQSTGVSINITAELDQALLAKPEELQRQVDELYQQAEQAIERQVSPPSMTGENHRQPKPRPQTNYRRPARNGNGHSDAMMTQSQRRAIESISKRLQLNPSEEIDREFGWSFNELTLKEASQVIDYLKSLAQPAATNGR